MFEIIVGCVLLAIILAAGLFTDREEDDNPRF